MPIKRNTHLQAISREHHHGLLLSWKIRTGLKKHIEPARIKVYADWFYKTHLLPHFEIEEKYIFPILGNDNELIKKVLAEHERLKSYFESETEILENLNLIEKELEDHIRFEERVLFNEIQAIASEEQLQKVKSIHDEDKFVDNQTDAFWL